MGYRPDVDGLRAVAVVAVLLYHAKIALCSGGYVGVDVFFVISGYLITGMVYEVATEGRFSFVRFYERRARRLLPAALTTLLLTSVASTVLLAGDHLKAFGASLLHATIAASNLYFWRQSDYFETSATLKPLLHTWSLAVEEQFYLVWPAFVALVGARARRAFWWIVLGLGCSSFAAAQLVIAEDSPTAFFLMPLRAWEFCLGALVLPAQRMRLPAPVKEALTLAGLGAIAWSACSYQQDTPFPGVHALAPTLGAALTILGGNPRYAGALLRNRLSVLIGRISYSVYLVHWPLIVLYQYRMMGEPSPGAQAGVISASLVGGWFMWRFIEEPYRYPERKPKPLSAAGFGLACASLSLALAVGAAHLWTSGGWRKPRSGNRRIIEYIGKQWETQLKYMEVGTCFIQKDGEYDPAHCLKTGKGKPNFLVIGDSFAGATFAGMKQVFDGRAEVSLLASAACRPLVQASTPRDACRRQCELAFERLDLAPYDIIFLTGNFNRPGLVQQLPEAVQALRTRGARQVIVLGSPLGYTASVEDTFKALSDVPKRTIYAQLSRLVDEETLSMDALAKTLTLPGGTYLSLIDVLCPDGTAASCRHDQPSGMPIIADKGHINPDGAAWILRELEARGAPWAALTAAQPVR